jgi:hypothetical protein
LAPLLALSSLSCWIGLVYARHYFDRHLESPALTVEQCLCNTAMPDDKKLSYPEEYLSGASRKLETLTTFMRELECLDEDNSTH